MAGCLVFFSPYLRPVASLVYLSVALGAFDKFTVVIMSTCVVNIILSTDGSLRRHGIDVEMERLMMDYLEKCWLT